MGAKYASVSVSGYNASPPPDNASTGADNQLEWGKHVTKLGNPLKTAIEAVNSRLLTELDQSARLVSGTDSTVAADHNRTLQLASTITATVTISLGDAATMGAGYIVTIANQSATVAHTIGRATGGDTIDGVAANVTIGPKMAITFMVNSAATGYIKRGGALIASIGTGLTLTDGDLLVNIAVQADQETGTSTTKFVTPGYQHYHSSAAKGWINVGVTGNPQQSYNVLIVTDVATGQITVNWNVDFSAANYCVLGQGILTSEGTEATFYTTQTSTTPAVGSSTHTFLRASDFQPVDPATWAVVAFGDQ